MLSALPLKLRKRIDIDDATGCWNWTAGTAGKGYAYGWWNGGMSYIHRVTYHLITDDTFPVRGAGWSHGVIDHLCANRACVNPEHLENVSQSTNLRRHYAANPKQRRAA